LLFSQLIFVKKTTLLDEKHKKVKILHRAQGVRMSPSRLRTTLKSRPIKDLKEKAFPA